MRKYCKCQIFAAWVSVCPLLFPATSAQAEDGRAYLSTRFLSGSVGIKSWKTLRDERIVKQNLDHSCGAAPLATLLDEHYGQNLSEPELLLAMATGGKDLRSSFQNMRHALLLLGFQSFSFATNYEQLTKLKIPVIVYLEHRKGGHFSVLRGISASTVWLADPSLGNRTYSRSQFLAMWDTRTGKPENAGFERPGFRRAARSAGAGCTN